MKNELNQLLASKPTKVPWKEIVDFDTFDERLSAVGTLFVNTIGVLEDSIEFIPDFEPATREEELSWIWSFRPDLSEEMLKLELSNDFRMLINCCKSGEMEKFWEYMS